MDTTNFFSPKFIIIACIAGLVFSNWSQIGGDSKNTYKSAYSGSRTPWSVDIDGYGVMGGEFDYFLLSSDGLIWYKTIDDWSEMSSQVTAISAETGEVQFSKPMKCPLDCGLPILSTEGDYVYYGYLKGTVNSISKDGEDKWTMIVKSSSRLSSVMTFSDIYVYISQELLIGAVYDTTQMIWMVNMNATNTHMGMSKVTPSEYLYFTEYEYPFHFWIVDSRGGTVIQKKLIPFADENTDFTRFAIDSDNKEVYITKNWNENSQIVSMKDISLDLQWNTSLPAIPGDGPNYCTAPLIVNDDYLSVTCGSSHIIDYHTWPPPTRTTSYVFFVERKSGNVYKKFQFTKLGGCSNPTLVDEDRVVVMCPFVDEDEDEDEDPVKPVIMMFTISTGEQENLVEGENFLDYVVSDSSGCLYYAVGVNGGNPVTMKKLCV